MQNTPAELLAISLSRKHRRKSNAIYQEALAPPATTIVPPLWKRLLNYAITIICLPIILCRLTLNWLRDTLLNWLTVQYPLSQGGLTHQVPRELIAGEGQLLEKLEQKVSTLETRLKAVKKKKNKEVRMLRKAVEEQSPFINKATMQQIAAPVSVAAPPLPPPPPFLAPRAAPMPPPPPPGGKLTLKAPQKAAIVITKPTAPPKPKATGGPTVTLADLTSVKLKKAESAKVLRPQAQNTQQPLVSLSDLAAIKLKKSMISVADAKGGNETTPVTRLNSLRRLEVQRSPGGTPMKTNKENVHSYSTTDIVSTALKSSVQRASSLLSLRASPTARSPSHFDSPK